jgi:hypothetical protein
MAQQELGDLALGPTNMPFPDRSRPSKSPVTGLPPGMSSVYPNTYPTQPTETLAQTHGNIGESELVSQLLKRIDDLERGVRTSASAKSQSSPLPGTSCVR